MTAILHRAEPAAGQEPPRRSPRSVAVLVAGSAAIGALVAAVVSGAWGVPRTDDWAFARVAFALHRTGGVHLLGWAQMNLLGLVAWAQPWLSLFGDHLWVLDLAGLVLVTLGLVMLSRAAPRLAAGAGGAIVVATTVTFPGFIRDIPTFMTDAPALAVQAAVLAVGALALTASGHRRTRLLWLAVALGLFGFTIREFAIAAPLAVLAAAYITDRRTVRRMGAVTLGAAGAFYLWRIGLPGAQQMHAHPGVLVVAMTLSQAAATLSLGLVPVLLWTLPGWRRPVAARARALGAGVGLGLALIPPAVAHHFSIPPEWLVGHYLDRAGVNGSVDTLGTRPQLIPSPLWGALTVLGVAAMVVLCALVAERLATRRSRAADPTTTMLGAHAVLALGACGGAAVLNGAVFDRYLWPVVISGGFLLVRAFGGRVPARRLGVAALAGAAALSVALTLNSNAYDAARWHAGERLVAAGLAPQSIDAGFEWTGAHATAVAVLDRHDPTATSWWTAWFPHPTICAVVAASPVTLDGFVQTATPAWNLLGFSVREHLRVYRRMGAGCPPIS